jgi:hypothetical protein
LIRWEYFREPPKATIDPVAHVHVAADFQRQVALDLGRLHIPTRRIPLELVIWHLITEWGVKPKSDGWREIPSESIRGWQERRTHQD